MHMKINKYHKKEGLYKLRCMKFLKVFGSNGNFCIRTEHDFGCLKTVAESKTKILLGTKEGATK